MTLIQLTAAYAAVAANSYPVEPHGFKEQEKGWFENLVWGPSRFGSGVHEDLETMLRAAVNRGTGRAARLPQANYGKTGTTPDHRHALFVGYANDLAFRAGIGTEEHTPITGTSVEARPTRMCDAHRYSTYGHGDRPQEP